MLFYNVFLFRLGAEHAFFHLLQNFQNIACHDIKISFLLRIVL